MTQSLHWDAKTHGFRRRTTPITTTYVLVVLLVQTSRCASFWVSTISFRSVSLFERCAAAMEEQQQQQQQQPLLSVGMIADIQYAPVEDGFSFSGTPRYYRHSLIATRHAFETFSATNVDLVVNLGDTIDGKCQEEKIDDQKTNHNPGLSALLDVTSVMESAYRKTILHTYGNHCLYNLHRTELKERLGIPFFSEASSTNDENDDDLVGYYSHVVPLPHDDGGDNEDNIRSIKFIVLDGYDIALMRRCEETSVKQKAAVATLLEHNGKNYRDGNENSPEGLEGVRKRFVAFNGAVGSQQLEWLRSELELTLRQQPNQKVVVISHNTIHPESSNPVCLIWNYEEILSLLRDYASVVMACFAGHAHKGGYVRDEPSGIHFRVVEAVLESKPPARTFGILNVFRDKLVVEGYGDCVSAVYDLDHCSSNSNSNSNGTAATSAEKQEKEEATTAAAAGLRIL